ncbi:alpha/beta hydrolase [Pseudonocardia endophytica]|uniref:Tripeptidyl-peptidase B n=1 Tax=Pseudonocardia endophytica TaxID=401976 RepID=A0A4R1HMW3_PSEEN|nr:alpha/beta hydrolase [Pseudonocardia endophytica]TCK21680.1 tripeptidyl-peptidase B [Pseudonocardia endophytica]
MAGLLAVLTVLLGACSGTDDTAQTAPPPPEPAQLAAFYSQKLQWGPCTDYASSSSDASSFQDPSLDCTRVRVPLNYDQPQGATAEVALLRRKATGDKIGSLFMDPGGPGVSGTSFGASQAKSLGDGPLGKRFDLIGFDPRGVGASRPAIDCLDDEQNDEERTKTFSDPSPGGVAAAEADSKLFADRCAQKTGGDKLEYMGTRDVARDMDVMRAAVGDEKLTYAGFSYGTELGTAYAEAFPQRVRALVLDGAIDPTQSPIDSSVKQSAGFQLAFDNFAKDCTSKPNCPLGTDPAQATARFQAIMRPLLDKPVPIGDGRTLGFDDALTGVTQALYLSDYWPILQRGISEVATGSGRVLGLLADSYYERDEQGRYTNSLEAFQAITCVNQPPVTDPAQVKELADRTDQAAPFRSTGRGAVAAKDACAFWPVPPTQTPHTPNAPGLPPTLVVSVTGDPATPYQAGVDLAQQLGGSLLKVEGNQHTASLRGDPCIDPKVISYLIDLKEPDEGAQCSLPPA